MLKFENYRNTGFEKEKLCNQTIISLYKHLYNINHEKQLFVSKCFNIFFTYPFYFQVIRFYNKISSVLFICSRCLNSPDKSSKTGSEFNLLDL